MSKVGPKATVRVELNILVGEEHGSLSEPVYQVVLFSPAGKEETSDCSDLRALLLSAVRSIGSTSYEDISEMPESELADIAACIEGYFPKKKPKKVGKSCVACGGSGISSKGGTCVPCQGGGQVE